MREMLRTLIETLEDSTNCNFMFVKLKHENENFFPNENVEKITEIRFSHCDYLTRAEGGLEDTKRKSIKFRAKKCSMTIILIPLF